MSKELSTWGWYALLVAVLATAVFHSGITYQLNVAKAHIARLQEENQALRQELEDRRTYGRLANRRCYDTRYTNFAICDMLRKNAGTSREDFIVRAGPYIVWGEVAYSPAVKKLALYLPPGRHRLKFGIAGERSTKQDREAFLTGQAKRIQADITVELGPATEIYEVEARTEPDGVTHLAVRDAGNQAIHESSLSLGNLRGGERPLLPKDMVDFPSEIKLETPRTPRSYPYASTTHPRPVTELGILPFRQRNGEQTDVWVWIESDAPACMSAIEVAANYGMAVAMFEPNGEILNWNWSESTPDVMFTRLFKTYDGSGLLHFNDGVFAEQMPEKLPDREAP